MLFVGGTPPHSKTLAWDVGYIVLDGRVRAASGGVNGAFGGGCGGQRIVTAR
jgi:hypothetical protein